MSRSTPALLRVKCPEAADVVSFPDATLQAFIDMANMVTTNLVGAFYTDQTQLQLIETQCAAHFFSVAYNKTASEKAGDVQENFQYQLGLNFNSTGYGQQLLVMDITGRFANQQGVATRGKKLPPATFIHAAHNYAGARVPGIPGNYYGPSGGYNN